MHSAFVEGKTIMVGLWEKGVRRSKHIYFVPLKSLHVLNFLPYLCLSPTGNEAEFFFFNKMPVKCYDLK